MRPLVRGAAFAALAASIAVPLLRKRLGVPAAVTTASLAAGPLGLAVLKPRTKKRDATLYAQQMWGFLMAHDFPYDDPEALRARLRIDYPIRTDRLIGGGQLPNAWLQRTLGGRSRVLDRVLVWTHWLWFMEPHAALLWILAVDGDRFPHAARQMAAVYDIGCVVYYAVPTAPPWWASEHGHTGDEKVERYMVPIGEETWGRAWDRMYGTVGGNPWAAMPSLHFAASLMAALALTESGPLMGAAGWTYAATLGFALVYLGEHYVTDLIAGAALVIAVRNGEPLTQPLVNAVNGAVQRLEQTANGRS